jgi:type IV pilus assembly protein PilM
MALAKKDHLVGLDIGSQSIKIAEIENGKSGRILKSLGIVEITPDLMEEEDSAKDMEGIAEKIKTLFKRLKIKEKKVALSVGGYSIIVKRINMQAMTEEKLLETIHYEAEQYIPFDINDVNLDFQILGVNENNRNQMNVLLVAAKKDLIEEYTNLVETAGRQPRIIDVDAFALQNAYESSYFSPEKTGTNGDDEESDAVALIDIGAAKTSLNILRGTTSLFMRDISMGCDQITRQIAAQVECPLDDAERIKTGKLKNKISQEEYNEILASFSTEWTTEVRRAFDFFYSSFGESDISRIILSGGGAHMEALKEMLSAETEASVETINPFGNLIIDNNKFEPAFLEKIAPQAAIALGLALRRVDDK